MKNAAFAELGLDWRYVRLPRAARAVRGDRRARCRGSGFRGANVTIPHKLAAHALADELSPRPPRRSARSTRSPSSDGRIAGDNTDAGGLLDALGEPPRGRRALVLGAGGAARAAVWALREAGARGGGLEPHAGAGARALADELGVAPRRPARAPADLLVNATSRRPRRRRTLLDGPAGSSTPGVVVDLVYGEAPTALCAGPSSGGARWSTGSRCWCARGARSLERWTGRRRPSRHARAPPALSRHRASPKPADPACRYARQWRSPAPSSSPSSGSRSSAPRSSPCRTAGTPRPTRRPRWRSRFSRPSRRSRRAREAGCEPGAAAPECVQERRDQQQPSPPRCLSVRGQRGSLDPLGAFEQGAANDMPKFELDARVARPAASVAGGFVSLGEKA